MQSSSYLIVLLNSGVVIENMDQSPVSLVPFWGNGARRRYRRVGALYDGLGLFFSILFFVYRYSWFDCR